MAAAQDPTPTIVAAALEREPPVPLCRHTLDLLIQILAAESGNMALRLLATGGVFLGGGMPRHLLPLIRADAFMATFRAKGRLDYVLDSIPVHVITHTSAGRLGAARRGLQLMSGDLGDSSVSKGGA